MQKKTLKPTTRLNIVIMGKLLGSAAEEREADRYHMYFTKFKRSKLGKKFVPDFKPGYDLYIDFKTAIVRMYSPLDTDHTWKAIKADWSVLL